MKNEDYSPAASHIPVYFQLFALAIHLPSIKPPQMDGGAAVLLFFTPSIIGKLVNGMIFQGALGNKNWSCKWTCHRMERVRFCKFNLRLPHWFGPALASIAWCFAANQKCSSATHLQFCIHSSTKWFRPNFPVVPPSTSFPGSFALLR